MASWASLEYHNGFGNHVESEAEKGALPIGRNNPQKCPMGLYAEQLSGTPFTFAKHKNKRSWLYRILPTVAHGNWTDKSKEKCYSQWISNFDEAKKGIKITPEQMRWTPRPMKSMLFHESIKTMMGAGSPSLKTGLSISHYSIGKNMTDKRIAMYSSDGDIIIVPQTGVLLVTTEFGKLRVPPKEVVIVPRGCKFSMDIEEGLGRGWLAESFKGHFAIPDLGPIGSNGLANERDFSAPTASYDDDKSSGNWTVVNRFMGQVFEYKQDHSPYDVVAWHGNYYPFKYDLTKFNTMGSISFDHPDPSIFTVLTIQTEDPGQAALDFVIFPPRWLVAQDTFRPPYYHRNTMSEFMGNISGTYDAKEKGFSPGASSLHSIMSGHGPEAEVFEKASNAGNGLYKTPDDSLAFMFETCYMLKLTDYAIKEAGWDKDYRKCWKNLKP